MALPQKKSYTYADLLEWEADPTHYELYDGQLRALSAPTDVHQLILTELLTQIHTHLRGTCRSIFPAPFDVRLFENKGDRPQDVKTVVQPDLSIVCKKTARWMAGASTARPIWSSRFCPPPPSSMTVW